MCSKKKRLTHDARSRSNRDLTENSDLCLIAAAAIESFLVTKIVDDYPIGVQATCMRFLLHVSIPLNSIITALLLLFTVPCAV